MMQPDAGPSPSGWRRYGEATGNVYVAGRRGIPRTCLLRSLRHLGNYGLEVVAANHEFCSGQFEINLWHWTALDAADRAYPVQGAVKELARQDDKQATFMAKPFNDEGGSGFHLHFSACSDDESVPLRRPGWRPRALEWRATQSPVSSRMPLLSPAAGQPDDQLVQALRPDTLAPWLVDWGLDNRSAMVRIPPERGRCLPHGGAPR